jgi:hypothetical protein
MSNGRAFPGIFSLMTSKIVEIRRPFSFTINVGFDLFVGKARGTGPKKAKC